MGAVCVNVQMLDHDTPTEEAITRARQVMEAAGRLEMDVAIEVHRDTCTETPEKAYALAEGFEKAEGRPLKMTWDFSHPAIIKHLSPPYWDRLAERVDLIQLAQQFHFRPFNGHHLPDPRARSRWRVHAGVLGPGLSLRIGSSKSGCKQRHRGGRCLSVQSKVRWAIHCRYFRIDGRMCKPFEVR